MIRVLIVEDSITQREIFRRLLNDGQEFVVVAEARTGREALPLVRQYAPDVVLMDIHMPDMDGIAATREIMSHCPAPIVVASGTLQRGGRDFAMQAYAAGAVSVVEKPEGAVLLHLHEIGASLRRELSVASKANVRRLFPPAPAAPALQGTLLEAPVVDVAALEGGARRAPIAEVGIDVIGICASTGGPPVLLKMLAALPRPFPVPMLLVQHISRGFEVEFARWLSRESSQPVRVAKHGERIGPGVLMGACERHLTLGSLGRVRLVEPKPTDVHCPSGNSLFESLAHRAGSRAAGVLLTGMGDDGAAGLLCLKRAGGTTMIQDERSCLIWGMPKAARELDAASFELPPQEIAAFLAKMRS